MQRLVGLHQVQLRRAGDGGSTSGGTVTVPLNVDLTVGQSQTWTLTDAATTTAPDIFGLRHVTTSTAAAGFGLTTWMDLESGGGTMRRAMTDATRWTVPTNAAETAARTVSLMTAGALTPMVVYGTTSDYLNANFPGVGSAAQPAVSVGPAANKTGLYSSSTQLIAAANGVAAAFFSSANIVTGVPIYTNLPGTAGFPAVFVNGTGGLFDAGGGLGVAVSGTLVATFGKSGYALWTPTTTVRFDLSDAATTTAPDGLVQQHATSGTPAAGYGTTNAVELHSSTNVIRRASADIVKWSTATNGAETSLRTLQTMVSGTLGDTVIIGGTSDVLGINLPRGGNTTQPAMSFATIASKIGFYAGGGLLAACWAGADIWGGNSTGFQLKVTLDEKIGVAIASAGTLPLSFDGNYVHVTGSVPIDFISTTNRTAGCRIDLYFDAGTTLNHNTGAPPGGTLPLRLVGAINAAMAAGSKITLRFDSTLARWVEVSRSGA